MNLEDQEALRLHLKDVAAKFVLKHFAEQDKSKTINNLYIILDSIWADARNDAREEGIKEGYGMAITILTDNRD